MRCIWTRFVLYRISVCFMLLWCPFLYHYCLAVCFVVDELKHIISLSVKLTCFIPTRCRVLLNGIIANHPDISHLRLYAPVLASDHSLTSVRHHLFPLYTLSNCQNKAAPGQGKNFVSKYSPAPKTSLHSNFLVLV